VPTDDGDQGMISLEEQMEMPYLLNKDCFRRTALKNQKSRAKRPIEISNVKSMIRMIPRAERRVMYI
jgi:hypothetical protein